MEERRHARWNDRQGTVGENPILVTGRKTSKVGLLLLAAYSNCIVNLSGYSRIYEHFILKLLKVLEH